MSKLSKLRRDPLKFFDDAKNPAIRAVGRTTMLAIGELRRRPLAFFANVKNPGVRAAGIAAMKALPEVMRAAESIFDPVSTTVQRHQEAAPEPVLVSVVVATHNGELTIARAVESVLSQTHENLEVIVVDDASGDASGDIVAEIAETDPRILLIQNRRLRGAVEARNQGMAIARGHYLAFHDANDVSHPSRIARQVSELVARPETLVCTTSYRNARGRTTRKAARTVLFRREAVIEKVGYMRGSNDGGRGDYLERIRAVFGATSERALFASLCEAQKPTITFEFSDGERKRLSPPHDESNPWPSPASPASAPKTSDEQRGVYVSYNPPEGRYVELHESCRYHNVLARIEMR